MNNKATHKETKIGTKTSTKYNLKNVIIFVVILCTLIWFAMQAINSRVYTIVNKESTQRISEGWVTKKIHNDINDTYFLFADCTSNAVEINGKNIHIRLFIRKDNEGNYISYFKFLGLEDNLNLNSVSVASKGSKHNLSFFFDKDESIFKLKEVSSLFEIITTCQPFSFDIKINPNCKHYKFIFQPINKTIKHELF